MHGYHLGNLTPRTFHTANHSASSLPDGRGGWEWRVYTQSEKTPPPDVKVPSKNEAIGFIAKSSSASLETAQAAQDGRDTSGKIKPTKPNEAWSSDFVADQLSPCARSMRTAGSSHSVTDLFLPRLLTQRLCLPGIPIWLPR